MRLAPRRTKTMLGYKESNAAHTQYGPQKW